MENYTEERTLSLSDRLVLDRTSLADERTFLAYVRTFIGMLSEGIAILKVFDFSWTRPIAYILPAASLPMLATGVMRYLAVARNLQDIVAGETADSYE